MQQFRLLYRVMPPGRRPLVIGELTISAIHQTAADAIAQAHEQSAGTYSYLADGDEWEQKLPITVIAVHRGRVVGQ